MYTDESISQESENATTEKGLDINSQENSKKIIRDDVVSI